MNNNLKISISIDKKTGALKVINKELLDISKSTNKASVQSRNFQKIIADYGHLGEKLYILKQGFDVLSGSAMHFIDTSASFEKFKSILTTIEGSSIKAEKSFNWVKEFGASTPYSIQQVLDSFIKLKAYGLDPTDGTLNVLGDTASAMGKDLNQAVEAMADAVVGENERLKEFGIRASKQGENIKYSWISSSGEVKDILIENNAKVIQSTLSDIFNEKYKGSMGKMSKTFDGMTSNMSDSWTNLADLISKKSGLFSGSKSIVFGLTKAFDRANYLLKTPYELTSIDDMQRRLKEISPALKEYRKQYSELSKEYSTRDFSGAEFEEMQMGSDLSDLGKKINEYTNQYKHLTIEIDKKLTGSTKDTQAETLNSDASSTNSTGVASSALADKKIITTSLTDWQNYYKTIGDLETAWEIEKAQQYKRFIDLEDAQKEKFLNIQKEKFFSSNEIKETLDTELEELFAEAQRQFENLDIEYKIKDEKEKALRGDIKNIFSRGIQSALNQNFSFANLDNKFGGILSKQIQSNLSSQIMKSDMVTSATTSLNGGSLGSIVSGASPYVAGAMAVGGLLASILFGGGQSQKEKALNKINENLEKTVEKLDKNIEFLSIVSKDGTKLQHKITKLQTQTQANVDKYLAKWQIGFNKDHTSQTGVMHKWKDDWSSDKGNAITTDMLYLEEGTNLFDFKKQIDDFAKTPLKAREHLSGYQNALDFFNKELANYTGELLKHSSKVKDVNLNLKNIFDELSDTNKYKDESFLKAQSEISKELFNGSEFNQSELLAKMQDLIRSTNIDFDELEQLRNENNDTELARILEEKYGADTSKALNLTDEIDLVSKEFKKQANHLKQLQDQIKGLTPATKDTNKSLKEISENMIKFGVNTDTAKNYLDELSESYNKQLETLNNQKSFVMSLRNSYIDIEKEMRSINGLKYGSSDIESQLLKIKNSDDKYLQNEINTFNTMLSDYKSIMSDMNTNVGALKDYSKNLLEDKELSILDTSTQKELTLNKYLEAIKAYKAGDYSKQSDIQKYASTYLSSIKGSLSKDEYAQEFIKIQNDLNDLPIESNKKEDKSINYLSSLKDILASKQPLIAKNLQSIDEYFKNEEAKLKESLNTALINIKDVLEAGISTNVTINPITINVKTDQESTSVTTGGSQSSVGTGSIDYNTKYNEAYSSFQNYLNSSDSSASMTSVIASEMRSLAKNVDYYALKIGLSANNFTDIDTILKSWGYKKGGFTGNAGINEIVGPVHGGEWVAPNWQIKKHPEIFKELENMRLKGFKDGGFTSKISLLGNTNNSKDIKELKKELEEIKQLLKENAIINQNTMRNTEYIAREKKVS